MTVYDNCWWCGAGCSATNLAGTEFHCPGCGESWKIVPFSEEEVGDEEDAPFMGIPLTAAQ